MINRIKNLKDRFKDRFVVFFILPLLITIIIFNTEINTEINTVSKYKVSADNNIYFTDTVIVDTNKCATFNDAKLNREIKVCGSYTIIKNK